ncbi:MAG: chromosome partitioning protein ParA, partial [Bacteroidales bacterium]|nr:chromosome partitioning protein ParA [Bacteroidales bacterium]
METTNQQSLDRIIQPANINQPSTNNQVDINAILGACFTRWWWFIISIFIVMAVAVIYLLITPNTYTRNSTFLIKNTDGNTSSFNSQLTSFSEMGLFDSKSTVYNELEVLRSPILILETIQRLHLDYNYYVDTRFKKVVIYGDSLPVTARLTDNDDFIQGGFTLKLDTDGSFRACEFYSPRWEGFAADVIDGLVGQEVSTPLGNLLISSTPKYAELRKPVTIYVSRQPYRTALQVYSKKFSADLADKKSSVISLTMDDENIQRAEDFLNTMYTVYNEKWIEDKNQSAIGTAAFINNRLEIIERELGMVDSDVSSFKSVNLLPDVEKSSEKFYTQANALQNEIVSLQTQEAMAKNVRDYISDTTKKNTLLPLYSGSNNSTAEKQITEYNSCIIKREQIISTSSDKNPLVIELDETISQLRRAIVGSIENQIKVLDAQIASLEKNLNKSLSHISSNPDKAKQLLSIVRQQKVKESLYLFLLQKREETELSQAFTAYNTRLITPPMGSMGPTKPLRLKILLIALV